MSAVNRPWTPAPLAAPAAPTAAVGAAADAKSRVWIGRWLVSSAIANGLMAGTYVLFSVWVMPMLGRKNDAGFVDSMQKINVQIENPLFFAAFFGAMVFPAIAAWKQRKTGGGTAMKWAVAAFALYTTTVLTTSGINVPLNEMLASKGDADPAKARADFEDVWNLWNGVRAVLTTAAFAAGIQAVRVFRRNRG
ncbi:hypothetical protein GCM10023205_56810 [Yinghuangia aomiensis]|uniref:DUF1772 domain-containing protein n=1 Tax=Yinghuangia aomiensis TaxID=676205 RepID=A0ABP9HW93_9ACTN